jgi:adenine-specific DNA-methyltransferase
MPIEKLRPKYVFDEQRIEELKQIAPEVFSDGKINWDTLKEVIGNFAEEDNIEAEHFGLFWPGKRESRKLASAPSHGTLVPVSGEGVNEKITRNIFIEGENLEVLKLLQKSYAGRVKMVYIDPPYNTGNDFIYDDNFTETIEEYLKRTGNIDEDGRRLISNSKADGRFHSKWLSMMLPRLRLARNLMREDGVIFISIDDNEIHNLRALMNEIFGEENFIAQVIWQKVFSPKNTAQYFSEDHEYIVVYSKNKEIWRPELLERSEDAVKRYTNPDNDSRGPWLSGALQARNYYSKGQYEVTSPAGKKYSNPKGTYWRFSKDRFLGLDKDNRIWWGESKDNVPRLKRFLSEVKAGIVPQTLWLCKEVGHTQEAKEELKKYVSFQNDENTFNTVKPIRLLKRILDIGSNKEEDQIILDFFGGSGTTAQAILQKNIEDGGKRQFILVQLPEVLPIEESNIKTISDLAKSRLKNYITEIDKENPGLGFKVIKLKKTNFKNWQNVDDPNLNTLEFQFKEFENPLIDNWKEEDLLLEILLIEGFPLDSTIEKDSGCKKNKLIVVSSDFCDHRLLVCLDKKVYAETIMALELSDKDVFICLDSSITDEQKLTLSDKGLIKTI